MNNKLTYRTQFTSHDSDVELLFESGITIKEALNKANIPVILKENVHVSIDGEFIHHDRWDSTVPTENSLLRVVLIPSGGDNNSVLRMVGAVAIAFAAPYLAGSITGAGFSTAWMGASGAAFWGAMAVNIGITILGSLLLNALFPPPDLPGIGDNGEGSPALSASSRNSLRPNSPIPRCYGYNKMWPPLGATPFSVAEAGEQYLYQLFDFGYGPLELTELKIGETLVSEYNEVEYYVHTSITGPESLRWFTNDIETEVVNANMFNTDINIRTTKTDLKYVQLDIIFPGGLTAYDNEGNLIDESVYWKIQVKNELDAYINIADYGISHNRPVTVSYDTQTGTATQNLFRYYANTEIGFTITITLNDFPDANTDFVTVELTRVSSSNSGVSQIDSSSYSTIRTFRNGTSITNFRVIDETGPIRISHTMVEMRIRATDQLNGAIDTFNAMTHSLLRTWEGYLYENLLVYSQDFDNAIWNSSPLATTTPNVILAPDGTMTGTKVEDDSIIEVQTLMQSQTTTIDSDFFTFTIHCKRGIADTSIGELVLSFGGGTPVGRWITWDWDTMVISPLGGLFDVSATYVGDGWFRFSMTMQGNSTGQTSVSTHIYPLIWASGGTTVGYMYIWGAQLTRRPQLLNYVTQFDNVLWIKAASRISVTPNIVTAPDGTLTADQLIMNGDADPYVYQTIDTGEQIAGKTFTVSFWAYASPGQPTGAQIFIYDAAVADIGSNPITLTTSWQRFTVTHTFSIIAIGTSLTARIDGTNTPSNGEYFFVWGAGLVEGYAVLDEIPYYRTTDTQNLDTGEIFVDAYTSNPAWIYLDLLVGSVNQRPKSDDRIDWSKLKSWADSNAELVYYDDEFGNPLPGRAKHTCNFIFDYSESLLNIVKSVASIGRATFDIRDDYYSVIFDEPKTIKTQLFSNVNSSNFSSSRIYMDLPDAVKVSFVDPESGWKLREAVAYNDGFTQNIAKIYEEILSPMTTNYEEAWALGRYWLKQAALRQETITISMDIDWLEATRGDLVGVQMDIMKVGGTSTRISEVRGTEVTLESDPTLNGNEVSKFELRPLNGSIINGSVAFYRPEDRHTVDLGITGARKGDLIVFNTFGQQTYDMLVKTIAVNADFSTVITLIEYAPELFDPESELIPIYDPSIGNIEDPGSVPNQLISLSATQVLTFTNGLPFISIRLDYIADVGPTVLGYRIYRYNSSTSEWLFAGNTSENYFIWKEDVLAVDNPILGVQQCFSVVAVGLDGGYLSPIFGIQDCITPVGDSILPEILDYFVVEETAEHFRRFWWDYHNVTKPIDFSGVLMRYTRGVENWSSATPLHDGILIQPPFEIRALPEGAQTIILKTVDTSGNLSGDDIQIAFNLGDRIVENVVLTEDLGYPWPGDTIFGSSVVDVNNDLAADPATTDLMWNPNKTLPMWSTSTTDLMWVSSYQGFTYIDSLTTTVDAITNLKWVGVGEFKFSYFEGSYPTDFIISYIAAPDDDAYNAEVYDLTIYEEIGLSNASVVFDTTNLSPIGDYSAYVIGDDDNSGVQSLEEGTISVVSSSDYTVSIFVLKDTDETRFSVLILGATGSGGFQNIHIHLNTKTGATTVVTESGVSGRTFGSTSIGDYWQFYLTVPVLNGNNQTFWAFRPASGTVWGTESSTTIGSVTGWAIALVKGSVPFNAKLPSNLEYDGTGQGIIPYTSPIFLEAGTYGVIIECPVTTEISEIDTLNWISDVPDINEYFEDYSVTTDGTGTGGGMDISLTKTFAAVTNVGMVLQGGTAVIIDLIAKAPTFITVAAYSDIARTTRVAATVDIRVQGY